MDWFEVALTSKDGDLYLSSNREFIIAYQLDEGDPTMFFSIIGLLYDNIYKYKNMDNIGWYEGYKLNVTYKKVKREDYPNIKFAPELMINNEDTFKPIGKKKYYNPIITVDYLSANNLKDKTTYITQTGMIVRYEEGCYNLIGTLSVDINKCDEKLVYDWFGYHVDDLIYEEFNEEKWKKHYNVYYRKSSE